MKRIGSRWNPRGWKTGSKRRVARRNRSTARSTMSLAATKRIGLWTVLGCLGIWAGSFVYEKIDAVASTVANVREVRVSGNMQVTQEEVLSRLALTPEDTLLSIDIDRLKARLEDHPWVQQASIERVPLHSIAVTIKERRIAAILEDARRSLLLDAEGTVLDVLPHDEGSRPAGYNLPVLKGLSADSLLQGDRRVRHRVTTGLRLASLMHEAAGAWPEVDLSQPHMMVASLDGNQFQFGKAFETQWRQFQRLAAQIPVRNGKGLHDIDLRYDGKIIVRERG